MMNDIEELNRRIISARFPMDEREMKNEHVHSRFNAELAESVRQHRSMNGVITKFQLLRNYVRTKKFVRTVAFQCP